MENIIPVINTELLQQKANEYAMKGAEEALKDFYTSYNSPYKKAIEENLKNKGTDQQFDIPDIIGALNEKFSEEIDNIANSAIANSFIPLVKKFLIREDSEVRFSDILKKFIERTDFEYNQKYNEVDISDYQVEKVEERYGSFFEYRISYNDIGYELRFYKKSEGTVTIMSLPYILKSDRYDRQFETKQIMKLSLEGGATLEMPFTKGILEDDFASYIARLVIGNNNIIFDVEDFDDDMFPENDNCHCH